MTFFTLKKAGYTPTVWCVMENNIYAHNKEVGFLKNHVSLEELQIYIGQLVTEEGFTVSETKTEDCLRLVEFMNKH